MAAIWSDYMSRRMEAPYYVGMDLKLGDLDRVLK
jgi:hypothetical protein